MSGSSSRPKSSSIRWRPGRRRVEEWRCSRARGAGGGSALCAWAVRCGSGGVGLRSATRCRVEGRRSLYPHPPRALETWSRLADRSPCLGGRRCAPGLLGALGQRGRGGGACLSSWELGSGLGRFGFEAAADVGSQGGFGDLAAGGAGDFVDDDQPFGEAFG